MSKTEQGGGLLSRRVKIGRAEAVAAIVGTIIGAGVFTLPYMAIHAGLGIAAIWLIIVSFLILYLHLAFGEIVLRTKKEFRLPGYVGHYLGQPAKKFVLITTFLTFAFSLLLYLLLGAQFLKVIVQTIWPHLNSPQGILVLFMWFFLSLVILGKSRGIARVNFLLSLLLLILFVVIIAFAFPHFQIANINLFHFSGSWGWLIPYGIIFYSLNGLVAIPEAAKILEKHEGQRRSLKKVVIIGSLIPVIFYFFFVVAVMGASGAATTLEAIQGLQGILGPVVVLLGAGLGFLAVATSYLIFASYIKNSFVHDFQWSSSIASFLVVIGPLLLYFLQMKDILALISFLGGMLGGLEGIMLILVFKQAKQRSELQPAYSLPLGKHWSYWLIAFLLIGALCQTFLIIK